MPRFHRIAENLFIVLMALGAMAALYALNAAINDYLDAVALYGADAWHARGWRVLPVGGTAVLEFAATAAFAWVYLRRGSNLLAPLVYLWSYAALGAVFFLLLGPVGRSGATLRALWTIPGFVALAALIALPGLIWNYRRGAKD